MRWKIENEKLLNGSTIPTNLPMYIQLCTRKQYKLKIKKGKRQEGIYAKKYDEYQKYFF